MTTASVRVQALRRYGQRSYVTADTSCTEIDQQIQVQPHSTATDIRNCRYEYPKWRRRRRVS